jgi:hypothetical protein
MRARTSAACAAWYPGVVKIVEKHLGRRRVKFQQQLTMNLPIQPVVVPSEPTAPTPVEDGELDGDANGGPAPEQSTAGDQP